MYTTRTSESITKMPPHHRAVVNYYMRRNIISRARIHATKVNVSGRDPCFRMDV